VSALGVLPLASAQDITPGKYTGNRVYVAHGGTGRTHTDTIELTIDKVEGGTVQGTLTRFEGACRGDTPVKGVLEGDKLTLRHVAKAGVREDCGLNWELKVAGQKL
jgi:polyisoprenoid-binding protein YceI